MQATSDNVAYVALGPDPETSVQWYAMYSIRCRKARRQAGCRMPVSGSCDCREEMPELHRPFSKGPHAGRGEVALDLPPVRLGPTPGSTWTYPRFDLLGPTPGSTWTYPRFDLDLPPVRLGPTPGSTWTYPRFDLDLPPVRLGPTPGSLWTYPRFDLDLPPVRLGPTPGSTWTLNDLGVFS
jgi:hypothetical protein